MYYIFNSKQEVISWCDFEPNMEDLNSRNEFYVFETSIVQNPTKLILGKYGSIFEPANNPKTQEELESEQSETMYYKRDKLLSESDWMINRHFEQKMLNINTAMSESEFQSLLDYRQSLRDITVIDGFPFVDIPVFSMEV